jgi:diguanylate cyclase (GGDEF)-like protein/PAS domain S-box-containing protein
MLVLDETGKIVDDSREVPPPDLNLTDRDYFQVHRDDPDVGMYLSHPFQSRFQQGEWAIAISRRISKPDGSFGGVVVGILDLDYFQSLFANLSLGPAGEITIFRDDGTLVARKPFRLTAIGRNVNPAPLFQQYLTARAGHYEFTPVSDGISRRFTFERIANLPLLVSVGFAVADIYAPWRQQALFAGALMMGFGLITVTLMTLLSREFARRRVAYTWLRDAFEAVPTGLVLFDAQDRFVLWNNRYVEGRVNRRIEVGMRYEDSLRESLSRGVFDDAIGREEEWLKERLARHNGGDTDYVQHLPNDRWVRIKETRTANGGRIGVRIDVTDLKRSEESFRLLLERNPLPMWVYDQESLRFLAVNDAAIEHYGYSKDEFLGMTILDISSAEDREKMRLFAVTAREGTYEGGSAFRHHKADGTEIEVVIYTKNLPFEGRAASVVAAIDVTEQHQAERRLAHYTRHDPLTNLGNSMALSEHIALARVRRANEPFAILCISLDHYQEISDGFGHAVGDELLCEVAGRLRRAAEGAFIARLGGDAFVLVVASGAGPAAAAQIADRLHSAMAEGFESRGQPLHIGLSIGVALYPTDGLDEQTLMSNADAALYRAKTDGRGVTHFFQPEMNLQLRERHAMQRDLGAAIGHNELLLYYQPQARISGKIFGFEALVRWRHQKLGMVGPDVFIPLAEETGLIVQIGEWVLREACREAASWENPLMVAVNLSPVQFRHNNLVGLVHAILEETGLAPHRLELEITERVIINDQSHALAILRGMKELGVRIAMDDFGIGYSSLSHLQAFPFDKIKIDQSFVTKIGRKMKSSAIIRAIIGLGHGLHMKVVAEGVEKEVQLAFLARESCDGAQGYLLGHPRPIADYAELVGQKVVRAGSKQAQAN